MNEGQLTDLVMERKDIPPMAKIVLRAIIRRVDWKTWTSKDGHKVVSTRELAKRCGTSRQTIIKSIARLEKTGLIQRDFFKATKTQAPPIKVNVDLIVKGGQESLPQGGQEKTPHEVKKVDLPAQESLPQGGQEKAPLSIKDNSNTILKQYINPSLTLGQECIKDLAYNGNKNHWGVRDAELWGDHLHNDLLNVIPQNTDTKDKD
jgi:DNA-binding Lrp family transcriptional regulator